MPMTQSALELQHVNVKLILRDAKDLRLEPLVPIFQNWIESQGDGELLIDVADYQHVEGGPGVILIGYEGNYSVDNTDNRLGVRYNRKAALDGSNQDRLKQATRAALEAFQRLEADPRLGGKLHFDGQEIEIFVNDRLLAPNNHATREASEADFRDFSRQLFRASEFSISHLGEPRSLFTMSLKAARPFSIAELLQNLA
jgi:hypothetical protein